MAADLMPAANRLGDLVGGIDSDQLAATTPCTDYQLADLLDHVNGLSIAFAWSAAKELDNLNNPPSGDASRLPEDWQQRIPVQLRDLAAAWRSADAWTGMTRAGGVDLPADVAGLVALQEMVLHGWDVSRASGQAFTCDEASLTAIEPVVRQFAGSGEGGPYGPPVDVPADAPLLERLLGLAGRDPGWPDGKR